MDSTPASYYIAVLLYESSVESAQLPEFKPLYEETFVLIRASSVEEARKKVNRYT